LSYGGAPMILPISRYPHRAHRCWTERTPA